MWVPTIFISNHHIAQEILNNIYVGNNYSHHFILQIIGPDDKSVYSGERESNGKYTFAAHMDGVYKYCFSNKMSTMTPKIVMFSMDIGDKPKQDMDKDSEGKHSSMFFYFNTY